jgi:hypothetical protein
MRRPCGITDDHPALARQTARSVIRNVWLDARERVHPNTKLTRLPGAADGYSNSKQGD